MNNLTFYVMDTVNSKETLWKEFGLWIKQQREHVRQTQKETAPKADITEIQLSRIENGSPTKRETVIALAKAIGCDVREALNRAGFDVPNAETPNTLREFTEKRFPNSKNLTDGDFEELQAALEAIIKTKLKNKT